MDKFLLDGKKIWIAGHTGMVGSAVKRCLEKNGKGKLILTNRKDLDQTNQENVNNWMKKNKPDIVIMCSAKVGGIYANMTLPADFIYDNLLIQTNIINAAHINNVKKLVFLGSSCIYPKLDKEIEEKDLLSGQLEKSNQWYAIAKIAGVKMCQAYKSQYKKNFISVMPCNIYGPQDNYDDKNSHVVASLIKKIHTAKVNNKKEVEIWGSGKPLREILFSDDLADAIVFLAENYSGEEPVNIGSKFEISITELALKISQTLDWPINIKFNKEYPDGVMRKKLDLKKITSLGWKQRYSLEESLKISYEWFLKNYSK